MKFTETGQIKVHNFPAHGKTFSYVTRTYCNENNKEIDGEIFYFHDLPQELLALAIIIGHAQTTLNNKLPRWDTFQ